jgi:hypothetical protein
LPLCGGVAGEAIAPHTSDAFTDPNNLDTSNSATPPGAARTCEQVMGNLCEVAIALLIFGTLLGWLTTVPMWLPQFFPKSYSATPWCVHFYSNSEPSNRLHLS